MAAVFVTGATGFVGGGLVDRLLAEEVPVRALVRRQADEGRLRKRGVEPVPGDLFDEEALAAGMRGCEIVYHVAGVNEMCPGDTAALYRTNVEGARNVVRSAARAEVRRVVCTSSAAAIGEQAGEVGVESTEHSGRYLSHYARSKHRGEQAVLAEGSAAGIEVVVVSPSSVQGPGRTRGSARLFLYALNRHRPLLIDVAFSIIDIADCSEGHVLAAQKGRAGERYLLSGAALTVGEAVATLKELTGTSIEPIFIPHGLATALSYPVGLLNRLGSRSICGEMLRTLLHGHRFDGSKATRELGLQYTPFAESLRRTVRWYEQEGLVRRG